MMIIILITIKIIYLHNLVTRYCTEHIRISANNKNATEYPGIMDLDSWFLKSSLIGSQRTWLLQAFGDCLILFHKWEFSVVSLCLVWLSHITGLLGSMKQQVSWDLVRPCAQKPTTSSPKLGLCN